MNADLGTDEPLRQHLFGHALRHGWYLVVACTLALGALALVATMGATPRYDSSATVVLQPTMGNALSPDATVNGQQVTVAMETESGLVSSPAVLKAVSDSIGVPESTLRSKVHATVPPNTKFVTITYRAKTAAAAQTGAQAFAVAFLGFRATQTTSAVDRQLTKIDDQETTLNKQLQALSGRNGNTANATRQALLARLDTVQASASALHATDAYPGSVSTEATLPAGPAGINPWFVVIAALLLGLGLGVVVAVVREALKGVVRVDEGLAPGGIPVLSELRKARGPLLPVDGDDVTEEAFRRLRVGIAATAPNARTLCLAPADPPCAVAAHAANLAHVMSGAGLKVEIADATSTHAVASLVDQAAEGTGTKGWERVGLAVPVWVVSHAAGDSAHGHVDSEQLEELVTRKRDRSSFLIVATDALTSADAEVAALASDVVVLVIEQGHTRVSHLEGLVARAHVLGISLSGAFSVPRISGRKARPVLELVLELVRKPARQPLSST
jgi:capsular polysaccharide biosynthesis protein